MRVLVIGDTHVPEEAEKIPEEFLDEAEECDLVICTGDLTDEGVLEELEERTPVRAVRGEEDYLELPEQDLVRVEDTKIGVVHGHQLEDGGLGERRAEWEMEGDENEEEEIDRFVELAEMLKVDVLVTGHTHKPFRTEKEGVVLLNPGSATGVGAEKGTCIVLEVQGTELVNSEILTAGKKE
ncbi:MAG: YfcE family phosphodiesterase [Candidatus Aenigmatarchaeota archaeon]